MLCALMEVKLKQAQSNLSMHHYVSKIVSSTSIIVPGNVVSTHFQQPTYCSEWENTLTIIITEVQGCNACSTPLESTTEFGSSKVCVCPCNVIPSNRCRTVWELDFSEHARIYCCLWTNHLLACRTILSNLC